MARSILRVGGLLLVLATVGRLPALAVSASGGTAEPPDGDERPNIFLIVIDTLRADHLSSYGYERETSPRIDALAAEGTLYEEAISPSPWTLPAHASLFTGLPVRDHGTSSAHLRLDPEFDTLAELLGEAGYRTGGFSNNVWTNPSSGLKQGFETFHELWRLQDVREDGISADDPATDMGARKANEEIFAWLDDLGDGAEPFFGFVNYFEPHLPYRPPRPFDDHFLPESVDAATVQRLRSLYSPREYGYILRVPWMKVSPRDLEILTALYDAEIAYVDSMLGRLVDGLRERGLLEDTVLIITSDHGEHLGENHMLGHKFSVYEPLLRVPLILWNPERIPGGERIQSPVQTSRAFATVLELAGLDPETVRPLPSRNEEEHDTFAEYAYPQLFLDVVAKKISGWNTSPVERALEAVRGPRYKLIVGSDGTEELYDLEADPLEERDLTEVRPEGWRNQAARLRKALEEFRAGRLPE